MTLLCASILVEDAFQARRAVVEAAEHGAEMVELRLDRIKTPEEARQAVLQSTLPVIATVRSLREGGESNLADPERMELLRACLDAGASYVDLEFSAFRHGSSLDPARLIVSFHDFQTRPARLASLITEMLNTPAAVLKLAWRARTVRDNLECFEILRNRAKPTIALCMGADGEISRILARKFGGFLTFASVPGLGPTAPGQLNLEELKTVYRWEAITPHTRVYGVVGDPISHSLSPRVHNFWFERARIDAVYVPFRVGPGYESFKAFMEEFAGDAAFDLAGLSITVPHKENAYRYLVEKGAQLDALSRACGAANSISVQRDDSGNVALQGFNTDGPAILHGLRGWLEELRGLQKPIIGILGAGGAARTAAGVLAGHGCQLVITNRTLQKAEELARQLPAAVAVAPDRLHEHPVDILVQATPLGMQPTATQTPIQPGQVRFRARPRVFDMIYNPARTQFLRDFAAIGAEVRNGSEMFVHQAACQFRQWTGISPDEAEALRVMRSVFGTPE
jgi:3-dehydroquinate dehydratase/shikimate dehydrogenase